MSKNIDFERISKFVYKTDFETLSKDINKNIKYIDKRLRYVNESKIKLDNNLSLYSNTMKDLDKTLVTSINYILMINKTILENINDLIDFIKDESKISNFEADSNITLSFSNGKFAHSTKIKAIKDAYQIFVDCLQVIVSGINRASYDHANLLLLVRKELKNYFLRSEPTLEQIILYYDKFNLSFINPDTKNKFQISTQGSSIIDNMLIENLQSIKIEKLEEFLKSIDNYQEDLITVLTNLIGVLNYNFKLFIDDNQRYIEMDKLCVNEGLCTNHFLSQFCQVFYSFSTDEEIFDYIYKNIFRYNFAFDIPKDLSDSEKISFIANNIKLVVMKFNAIMETFINIIKLNYSSLYINFYTKYKNKAYKDAISRNRIKYSGKKDIFKSVSTQELNYFNNFIKANFNSCVHYGGQLLDFSDIGLGQIIVSQKIIDDKSKVYQQLMDLDFTSKILTYIASFEISIITHGKGKMISFIDYYNELRSTKNKYYDYYIFSDIYFEEIKYLERLVGKDINKITGNEFINLNIQNFTKNNTFYIKIGNTFNTISNGKVRSRLLLNKSIIPIKVNDIYFKRWIIADIYTPLRTGKFKDMECLIGKLLIEGYKRINCLVCNPEGVIFSNERFTDPNNKIAIAIRNIIS